MTTINFTINADNHILGEFMLYNYLEFLELILNIYLENSGWDVAML